ncbi:tetratricopeptide repeat protein [Halioxenophilus aromaticivorans]|uniref:Tetratricopeptide repeat protein n=1 Tax=Halioxenophilus aromaticivorans TaxID=1306992 RepID=A0AAV3U694_9ALTE
MKFTNLAALASATALLSACAGFTSPPPLSVPQTESAPASAGTTLEVEALPPGEEGIPVSIDLASPTPAASVDENGVPSVPAAMPNPYLANAQPVSESVQKLFDRALEFHRDKNWPEAELAWQELALAAPRLSGPLLNLGIVYEATERPELAENSYKKAIQTNSLNVNAYNQLAILKRKQGKFAEAETLYTQALRVWPDHPESHRNIAILYDLYMGKLEQALAHYQRYSQLEEEPERALKGWIRDLQRRLDINS